MKNNHYPSLDLCKKLTDIWFPRTEKYYNPKRESIEYFKWWLLGNWEYWCPSVMEMLDEIPWEIKWDWATIVKNAYWYYVWFDWVYASLWRANNNWQVKSLPNALAEMVLWLHETNYISFTK